MTSPPVEGLGALSLANTKEVESNPWASKDENKSPPTTSPAPLAVTDVPPPMHEPEFKTPTAPPPVDKDVLLVFDPLADNDLQKPQDAWADAEAHPPPKPSSSEPPPKPIEIQSNQEAKKDATLPTPDKAAQKPLPPDPDSLTTADTIVAPIATAATNESADRTGVASAAPSSASAFTTTFASLARSLSRPRSAAGDAPSSSTGAALGPSRLSGEVQRPTTPSSSAGVVNANARSDSGAKSEAVFDFQRFLDQLKTRSAEPVAQYFRSFLNHFSRRTFTVQDQVKLVHQFLAFIEPKMRECGVWKRETPEEFENSVEAMEKLVMNRVFEYTFTPQIAATGRPVTTDDLERDRVLSQRIKLLGWVSEEHLDIPVGENNEGFLNFAQQELLKIDHYKAPRDKMICILNCCKVIFGLIRQLKKDEGADAFMPVLILVVLKANPEHLISNIEYIQRFRSPSKLQSEAGYYLSSLTGAASFIETMDHTSLSHISQEEFEQKVEDAIQHLPPSPSVTPATPVAASTSAPDSLPEPPKTPSAAPAPGEESASALQLPTPASVAEDTRKFLQRTGNLAQQTISKPLNVIGKMLSDALDGLEDDVSGKRRDQGGQAGGWSSPGQIQQFAPSNDLRTPQRVAGTQPMPIQAPYKARVRGGGSGTPSPSHTSSSMPTFGGPPPLPPRGGDYYMPYGGMASSLNDRQMRSRSPSPAGDVQQRNLEAEIGAIENAHRSAARETVVQIFPSVEGEVVDMVLEANGGDLGRTIDALLEMSSGG